MNIKQMLSDETLFKNADVFDNSHVPDDFAFRNNEMQALASFVKPALRGSRPISAFITGIPATGKTTAVRKLSQQIDNILICHVNCQTYKTSYRIFSEIHKSIFGFIPPETGIPFASLFDKIFSRLERMKKVLLVVLDEVNELEDRDDVLYNILRANESFEVKTGIWAISCDNKLHELDDKTRSVFCPEILEFKPYSFEQIKHILKSRITAGLYANVMTKEVLEKISDMTSAKKDLRYGIELIRRSAMNAENSGSRKILISHVPKNIEPDKNSEYDAVLKLIGKKTTSGELYKKINKETPMSYSSFRRLLMRMEKKGIISRKVSSKGRGKTSEIRKTIHA